MGAVQFINTTPEELAAAIANAVKTFITEQQPRLQVPEELLTREETARYLKISLTTLNNWTSDKKLKAYGIRNRVYYKRSEVEASLILLNG